MTDSHEVSGSIPLISTNPNIPKPYGFGMFYFLMQLYF